MEGRSTDVNIALEISANRNHEVKMQLKLTNNSPNDYWISKDVLLMDGFKGKSFSIYGGPSEIRCHLHTGDHPLSGVMLVKSGTIATGPELLLSNVCSFKSAKPGIYILNILQYSALYTNDVYEAHKNGYTPNVAVEYLFETIEAPIIIGEHDGVESIT